MLPARQAGVKAPPGRPATLLQAPGP